MGEHVCNGNIRHFIRHPYPFDLPLVLLLLSTQAISMPQTPWGCLAYCAGISAGPPRSVTTSRIVGRQ